MSARVPWWEEEDDERELWEPWRGPRPVRRSVLWWVGYSASRGWKRLRAWLHALAHRLGVNRGQWVCWTTPIGRQRRGRRCDGCGRVERESWVTEEAARKAPRRP